MLCDIGYVIKDHIPAMMQLMTNHIRSYNMQLLTTKCLNTAVMMWYLFLGERADVMVAPDACNSSDVRKRGLQERSRCTREKKDWEENDMNPRRVTRRLKEALLMPQEATQRAKSITGRRTTKQVVKRTLYYVMLTSCSMPPGEDRDRVEPPRRTWRNSGRSFPGHVFVIEKVGGERNRYNVFQSYINEYTLSGHSIHNRSFAMSEESVADIADGIHRMYSEPVWSPETTAFWNRFTHVDTRDYEGYRLCDESFVCFRTADTSNCVYHLHRFLKRKAAEMEDVLRTAPDEVYGDASRYDNTDDQELHLLTNREIYGEIETMLAKI